MWRAAVRPWRGWAWPSKCQPNPGEVARRIHDVILSYPGVPDMDYETLARIYAGLRTRKDVVEKTTPTIEEILVSGDLGIIRLMWTHTTETATGRPLASATRRRLGLVYSSPMEGQTRSTRDLAQ